jgi:hypothetical protein
MLYVVLEVKLLERLSFGEFTCIQNNLSFQMKEKIGEITLPDLSVFKVFIIDCNFLNYVVYVTTFLIGQCHISAGINYVIGWCNA